MLANAKRRKTRQSLVLVPRWGIFLTRNGHPAEERFAGLFWSTWSQIPASDRGIILNHWRHSPWTSSFRSPRIELLDCWQEPLLSRSGEPKPSRALASCDLLGHELRFRADVVHRMPISHVRELIAHELAHILPMAAGDFSPAPACEVRADRQMARWGFDPFAMDEWVARHVQVAKDGRTVWHEAPLAVEAIQDRLGRPSDGRFHPRYLNSQGQPMSRIAWAEAIRPCKHFPDAEKLHGRA